SRRGVNAAPTGTQRRPVLGSEPGLQAGGVVGPDCYARPVLLSAEEQRVDRMIGRRHGVSDGDQAAVLAAVDPLVLSRPIALGLEPDEQRLSASRAASATG